MTGPRRMRPESAEADSELAVSYVIEPERRMADLSVDVSGSAVASGRRSARGNWHSRPRIGIMGGTFDPIHNGHLVAASEVSWVYDLDEVIFVPTGRPVFKLDKRVTNAEDRYLMTVIATASNPKFTVSRVDIDRPGITYVARHQDAASGGGTVLHHRCRCGRRDHAVEGCRQDVGAGPLRGRDTTRILVSGRRETSGRQSRHVGDSRIGDFVHRRAPTRRTW